MVDNPLSREKFRAAAVSKCLGRYDIDVRRTNISKYLFAGILYQATKGYHTELLWQQIWSIVLTHMYIILLYIYLCICRPGCLCTVSGALILKSRGGWVVEGQRLFYLSYWLLNIWKLLLSTYPTGWYYTQNLI